jgi:hypothetical protein
MTSLLRRAGVLPLLLVATSLTACAGESEPTTGQEEANEIEARPGQDLVACWTEPDTFNRNLVNVRCKLAAPGAMKVVKASLSLQAGSTGTGATLTPEEPEKTLFSTNMLSSSARIDATVTVDASDVVGLETFQHQQRIELAGKTIDEPGRVRAPFDTWRLSISGEDVAVGDAKLAPWDIALSSGNVTIDGELPDVAKGETAVVYLPVQTGAKHEGTARFGAGDAAKELPIVVEGPGAYLAREDGFDVKWAPSGDLPVELSCWIAGEDVVCQAQHTVPVAQFETTLTHADGRSEARLVLVDDDADGDDALTTVIDQMTGTVEEIPGISPLVKVGKVDAVSFPLKLDLAVSAGFQAGTRFGSDWTVVGFDDTDPFVKTPLKLSTTVGSANEAPQEAPIAVTLPFAVWEITLIAAEGPRDVLQGQLEPYDVHVGAPWAGHQPGDEVTIGGTLPHVTSGGGSDGIPRQTFYLPVEPGRTAPIAGTMVFGSKSAFTFPGPGKYVASSSGISLAP